MEGTSKKIKKFTIADLKKHRSKNDMWIAVHGRVYDITGYKNEHPGGRKVLSNLRGTDATHQFID